MYAWSRLYVVLFRVDTGLPEAEQNTRERNRVKRMGRRVLCIDYGHLAHKSWPSGAILLHRIRNVKTRGQSP
jgi:hypothetical protein